MVCTLTMGKNKRRYWRTNKQIIKTWERCGNVTLYEKNEVDLGVTIGGRDNAES